MAPEWFTFADRSSENEFDSRYDKFRIGLERRGFWMKLKGYRTQSNHIIGGHICMKNNAVQSDGSEHNSLENSDDYNNIDHNRRIQSVPYFNE